MGDLVERLRSADMNSQQRVLGSRIFGEAADEITNLRAALADAQAVGFAAGVEAAAKRCDAIAGNTADFNQYHRRAAGQCGAAIRAIAGDT